MPRVTRRISAAAQHYGFQLILIGADVASGPREAASFLCKLELLEQEREAREGARGRVKVESVKDARVSFQEIHSLAVFTLCLLFIRLRPPVLR